MSVQSGAQQRGKYLPVNGLSLYYEEYGSGFPLVLIHGGGSTIGTTFGRILPALARDHRVIAVELQAHGHTADRGTPLSFEQDADDVATLLSALHIGSADIFGFSNGASTTLQLAIRHPALARKIIVASTFYKKSGAQPWFFPMITDATFETMPAPYKKAFLEINHDTAALRLMYERDVARMRTFRDITDEQIASITAPALVICGDRDVLTAAHAVEMASRLQHARLAIFPGGHGGYIGELATLKPGATTFPGLRVILDFLADDMPVKANDR